MSDRFPDVEADANRPVPASALGRRAFIAAAALALTGCSQQRATSSRLPVVPFPSDRLANRTPVPVRDAPPVTTPQPGPSGIIARTRWAADRPVPSRMNRMLPIRYITIHHDGMAPFVGDSQSDGMARLEQIRRFHRDSNGWGDIGYHFAVDRGGRIYEARQLMWQGAHVKDHNEGNIGIVALGNFEQQAPTPQQVAALLRHTRTLMGQYSVPASRVKTHQEWAATACPGRNMQAEINQMRATGRLA